MSLQTDQSEGPGPAVRRMPVGAEVQQAGGVHFRVWAPACPTLTLHLDGKALALDGEGNGYFSGYAAAGQAGSRYGFRCEGMSAPRPDPASRFQPEGTASLSCVVDPGTFTP